LAWPARPGLEAVSWRTDQRLNRRAALRLLGALPAAVVRAKGVVCFAGASVPALVDVVAGRLSTQWEPALAAENGAALVFIGRVPTAWWSALRTDLEECITAG
jgi:hypothetical protein